MVLSNFIIFVCVKPQQMIFSGESNSIDDY